MKIWCWLALFSPKPWSQVSHPPSPSAEPADSQWGTWLAVFTFQRLLEWLSSWLILLPKRHQTERLQQTRSSLAGTLILWQCRGRSASSGQTAAWLGSRSCGSPCEADAASARYFLEPQTDTLPLTVVAGDLAGRWRGLLTWFPAPPTSAQSRSVPIPGPPSPTPRPHTDTNVLQSLQHR